MTERPKRLTEAAVMAAWRDFLIDIAQEGEDLGDTLWKGPEIEQLCNSMLWRGVLLGQAGHIAHGKLHGKYRANGDLVESDDVVSHIWERVYNPAVVKCQLETEETSGMTYKMLFESLRQKIIGAVDNLTSDLVSGYGIAKGANRASKKEMDERFRILKENLSRDPTDTEKGNVSKYKAIAKIYLSSRTIQDEGGESFEDEKFTQEMMDALGYEAANGEAFVQSKQTRALIIAELDQAKRVLLQEGYFEEDFVAVIEYYDTCDDTTVRKKEIAERIGSTVKRMESLHRRLKGKLSLFRSIHLPEQR